MGNGTEGLVLIARGQENPNARKIRGAVRERKEPGWSGGRRWKL